MRRTALALSILLSSGCATGYKRSYKRSYVTGAVTKQFATEAYGIYSDEFNAKIDECCAGGACDPESENVITKAQLDECMGTGFEKITHDDIEMAIRVYHGAARTHSDVMAIAEGSNEDRKKATERLIETAIDMLGLLPEGDKLVAQIKKLTGTK